jgi:hypothetical protein
MIVRAFLASGDERVVMAQVEDGGIVEYVPGPGKQRVTRE